MGSTSISELLDFSRVRFMLAQQSWQDNAFLDFGWHELDPFSKPLAARRPHLLDLGFCQEEGESHNVGPD